MTKKKESYKSNDVTFVNSKKVPFQRWYPYIEGYSPEFVKTIIRENVPNANLIYEPFAGTGTTLFASDFMEIDTVYSEVNPLLRFLVECKLSVLNQPIDERRKLGVSLLKIADSILQVSDECAENEELRTSYNAAFGNSVYFPQQQFSKILKLRNFIDNLEKENILLSKLVTIGCFSCLLPVSYLKKQGDVRFKTEEERKTQMCTLEEILPEKIRQIAEDVSDWSITTNCSHTLVCTNAKKIGEANLNQKIDAVITSPPYLNGTNYFRNTKVELWFLKELTSKDSLRLFRDEALTSAICDVKQEYSNIQVELGSPMFDQTIEKLKGNAYDRRIPLMAKCYFYEMHELFSGLLNHINPGGMLFIDLGDSIFGGVHIPTDLILNEVLESIGYKFVERIVLRQRRSKNNAVLSQVLLKYRYK